MKQLTIVSGKGGTGKTSIVGAFAALSKNTVFADCDVDAADLHLILHPKVNEEKDFYALKTAQIDKQKCIECGRCEQHCRFNAIKDSQVQAFSCEGCAACTLVCPEDAITMIKKPAGKTFVSDTRFGPLAHARLNPGEEASGKLVAEVRENAKTIAEQEGRDLIIIDGSPGIGCPVIASITGVDLALVVTEPTLSGIHDLERILDTCEHFKIPTLVCVNKYDINKKISKEIKEYCDGRSVAVVGEIAYNPKVTEAMVSGKTIIEHDTSNLTREIKDIWNKVSECLN